MKEIVESAVRHVLDDKQSVGGGSGGVADDVDDARAGDVGKDLDLVLNLVSGWRRRYELFS